MERDRFSSSPAGERIGSRFDEIPEPHGFEVTVTLERADHVQRFETRFDEHAHGDHDHHHHEPEPEDDPLYAPLRGDTSVLTRHLHLHKHGRGIPHAHWHDHLAETSQR